MLTGLRRSCLSLCVLFCSTAVLAVPQHAMTLYDEAPKYPSDFTHFDYTNPDAPKGGTLRLAGLNGFDSLNPFIPKGNAADHIGLLYDTLTYHSADEPFTEYGLLAERIEKADDHSFVRFYLNPKARFNDGHPVTAEDVLFTFNTLVEKGHPLYRHYYADVAEVVVENPLQVRFDFKHSNNRELPLILGQLQILPKHWWAERDFTKTSLSPPLGSGPYRLVQVDAGRSLRYERVKDWWGKDLPVSRGLYNFDIIHIDYYRDMSVALEASKAGQFYFNLEYSAKDWDTGYNSPALRSGAIINMSSVVGVTGNAGQANYAASKAGVIGLTKATAKELAARGVTCNAIAPGFVETDMTAVLTDEQKSMMLEAIPLKRYGQVEDIANAAVFFAKNTYITGQVLNVDGGMVM